jgi:hypothetical protein
MNETAPAQQPSEKKVGPIVATLIIVLVLIIAALYVFASKVKEPAIPTDAQDATSTVSTGSPDLDSLQSDLNDSTSNLDKQNF